MSARGRDHFKTTPLGEALLFHAPWLFESEAAESSTLEREKGGLWDAKTGVT